MTELRYPNITGEDPRQQLQQLKRYLFQLVDQLNMALERLERGRADG